MPVVIILDHISGDGLHIAYVPKDGQTDLLVCEDTPMWYLDGCLEGHSFSGLD